MIELISEITQKNNGQFPLIDSNNIRGGAYTVSSLTERDNIPTIRRKVGMLCYVLETNKYYKLESTGAWTEWTTGASVGIPIFTQEYIDKATSLPEQWISIADKETDLNSRPYSREIKQSGTYVDILFSAIRKLQSEVAKLRNSFQYGIYSYTGKNTAMSQQVQGITNPDEEPLWCIEEGDLSSLYTMSIGLGHDLTPVQEVDVSTEGILKLENNVLWEYNEKDVEDPKLFLYLTITTLDAEIRLNDFSFRLDSLNIPKSSIYNVMVCLNRNKESSFIYLSVGNNNLVLKEGYLYNGQLYDVPMYINTEYHFTSILFNNLSLSKLNLYSKYQDFSKQVIPSAPTDQDYKYKVAHLTIRSVKSKDILDSISNQLPENELIFIENDRKLFIKNNNNLIAIGSSSTPTDSGMTKEELFKELIDIGLVKNTGTEQNPIYEVNDFADITLINEDTGKKFKMSVDSNGNIRTELVPDNVTLLSSRVEKSQVQLKQNVRGFVGQLGLAEAIKEGQTLSIASDVRLYADRVKIGAFYAPLDTDVIHGCNRAYIELENTSDKDFQLQGCYLHLTRPNKDNNQVVYHLPLTGCLKAGGTYLVVGKKYAELEDKNVVLKVTTFDQEWFADGELIDLTVNTSSNLGYGIALTYGNAELKDTDYLYHISDSASLAQISSSLQKSKCPRVYDPSFIDSIYYYKGIKNASEQGYWCATTAAIKSNTICKNTFELDPAKQAFQSCNTMDSSRARWASGNDIQILDLSKDVIEFPHSKDTYTIEHFTPKASFENKNVSTDKSKLDNTKPNMVTCSFGINIYTTRCFNWISVGVYDEYIYLRKQGTEEWTKISSYTKQDEVSITFPKKKSFNNFDIYDNIYKRITGRFPGDNTLYTAHKVVVQVRRDSPTTPEIWEYKVGRDGYMSDIQTFTLYPESYKPVIYQITDQQGFHWIEYQVWAAAASKLYEKIKQDQAASNIIPILINTGDMTQNGTRINEWFDYYQAGRVLFKEFEQMNVVGNNDLCGTDINELGTGDDVGKSNSFYFHVFYCYEVNSSVCYPVVNDKYIPSLYYFDTKDFRFIMINSEITAINCQQWFKLTKEVTQGDNKSQKIVNIYTGYTVGTDKIYDDSFTSIYTMVYNMLNTNKQCVVACHEMPFTVITNSSLSTNEKNSWRSCGPNNGALIGSHCNQLSNNDVGAGTYWLSRLLEYKHVKLCIGGHKHTYTCTYPLREYFLFGDGKNSKDNYSEYSMESTLQNDNVTWMQNGNNLTKFPLTKREPITVETSGIFYPYTPVPNLEGGVTYFMCQATGYKLTSNKELPSANQKFSKFVPETTVKKEDSDSKPVDTASPNQKYPMFGIITLDLDNYTIKLARITNIFNSSFKFSQNVCSYSPMTLQYLKANNTNDYGTWVDEETTMLTI